jgi:hypothetical protein
MTKHLVLFPVFIILLSGICSAQVNSGQISGTIIPFSVSYSPDLAVSDEGDSTRTFSAVTTQNASFEWYFNDNLEKIDSNLTSSSYTKKAGEGEHNITVVITNENGTVSVTWSWIITKKEESQPPRRSGGGGGGGSLLFTFPTPEPTPSPKPTTVVAGSTTFIPSPSTPAPTPEPETPESIVTETPEEEIKAEPQQVMDFSYGAEFFKWFRSVVMVSSSFVLAYFGKNSVKF